MASFTTNNIFKIPIKEFLDDSDSDESHELAYPYSLTPSPKTPVEKDVTFFESDFFPLFPMHHPYFRQYQFEYTGPFECFEPFKLFVFNKGLEIEAIQSSQYMEVESSDPLYAISDMNNILRETLVVIPTDLGVQVVCDNWRHISKKKQLKVKILREHSYTPIQRDGTCSIDFSVNFALVLTKFLLPFIPHNRGTIRFEADEQHKIFKQKITFSFCPMFGWTNGNALKRTAGDLYNRTIAEKIRIFLDFYFSTIFYFVLAKSKEFIEK